MSEKNNAKAVLVFKLAERKKAHIKSQHTGVKQEKAQLLDSLQSCSLVVLHLKGDKKDPAVVSGTQTRYTR